MKFFVFSDIHGSATACEKALSQFEKQNCDNIIILGDILYHGPRNPLPENYNPKAVVEMLNPLSGKIIACRGNCDSEVDQMMLKFPILADYSFIVEGKTKIFATHGHIYGPQKEDGNQLVDNSKLPPLDGINVLIYGHTHIQMLEKTENNLVVCNPGSISLPKQNSPSGFAIIENNEVLLYDLNGNLLKTKNL